MSNVTRGGRSHDGASPRILAGRYEITGVLGQGGMADVYAALDLRLDRQVAIKSLRPGFAGDRETLTRFRREATAVAALDHHGFVRVYDVVDDEAAPFIVMELVDGESLEEILRREGRLAPVRVAELGAAIAEIVTVAHATGLIHRDLKPGNVMVARSGQVKVLDFGIARAQSWTPLTSRRVVQGTAEYVSPEQARGDVLDARSDLYSLGILLYEMVTGAPPFTCDSPVAVVYKHLEERPAAPSRHAPVGAELETIIMRCLSKKPADRFADASSLERALREAAHTFARDPGSHGTSATAEIPRPITRRLPRRRARKAAMAAAVAGGAIGLGLLAPVVFGSERPEVRHRPPPLRPPGSLSATSECSGFTSATSTVAWRPVAVEAVSGYVVDRRTEGGPYENVGSLDDRAAVRFVDTGLDSGTTYHYRLRSVAGSRRSDPSETVEVGTPVLCLW